MTVTYTIPTWFLVLWFFIVVGFCVYIIWYARTCKRK